MSSIFLRTGENQIFMKAISGARPLKGIKFRMFYFEMKRDLQFWKIQFWKHIRSRVLVVRHQLRLMYFLICNFYNTHEVILDVCTLLSTLQTKKILEK